MGEKEAEMRAMERSAKEKKKRGEVREERVAICELWSKNGSGGVIGGVKGQC